MSQSDAPTPVLRCCLLILMILKKVNDTQGHSVGDKLLRAVANRLREPLRRVDVIRRFDGDKFVIVTDNLHIKDNIKTLCLHLLSTMKPAYQVGRLTINMNMSIGIASYPDDGKTIEDLLRNADTAMYAAKKLGGTNFHFYCDDMNQRMSRRIQLEEKLIEALTNQEISLVFQPIIRLSSGLPKRFYCAVGKIHSVPKPGILQPA